MKGPCCKKDTRGGSLVWLDRLGQAAGWENKKHQSDGKGHEGDTSHTRTWMACGHKETDKSRSCLLATLNKVRASWMRAEVKRQTIDRLPMLCHTCSPCLLPVSIFLNLVLLIVSTHAHGHISSLSCLLFFFCWIFQQMQRKKRKRVQGFGVWRVGGATDLLLVRILKLVFTISGISLLLPLACFDALPFWVTRGSFLIGRQKECMF